MTKKLLLGLVGGALVFGGTAVHAQEELGAGPVYVKNNRDIICTVVNADTSEELYSMRAFCATQQNLVGTQLGSLQSQFLDVNEAFSIVRTNNGGNRFCWCRVDGDGDSDASYTLQVVKRNSAGKIKKYETDVQGANTE